MANLVLTCFRSCFENSGFHTTQVSEKDHNPICLDNNYMGHEVVIIKDGIRACGSGGVLGNAPLVQSKSYFEVKLQQSGIWGVGLATRNANLKVTPGGNDPESWVFCYDGVLRHNKKELQGVTKRATEGDVIGVSFDHIELNFYINGVCLEAPITGIRGTVYPVIFVDDGAIMDIILDNFIYSPPSGFQKIMIEQSLL
ncbi:SPRY domain-containing protein 7 [Planococcus citri]|uniref:SPRY domain-containing protein 7 n=1 Tax=Planococcus citri TaxID=170843 RepID=UPI0031F7558D